MDFQSLGFKYYLISYQLLLLIIISQSQEFNGKVNHEASKVVVDFDEKVNLSLYFEPLNRTCASFIVRKLSPIFDNGLARILNLRLIPLENAQINTTTTTTLLCQNNVTDECELNTLEACTINVFQDLDKHFALIYCYEFLVVERRYKEWEQCFSSLGLPSKPVLDCLNSTNATMFQQIYANESAQLKPPLSFVPWIIINNQSIGYDYRNFTFYACKAYNGTNVPMACQNQFLNESVVT